MPEKYVQRKGVNILSLVNVTNAMESKMVSLTLSLLYGLAAPSCATEGLAWQAFLDLEITFQMKVWQS